MTVATPHRLAQIGLIFLDIAMLGVVLLNFDVVSGLPAGLLAATAAAVFAGQPLDSAAVPAGQGRGA